jgi:hypothetical protein
MSGTVKTIWGMAQRFIACDREQSFLTAPDVREWLPEGHLAWFVLDAVGAMDLVAFYAAYREDGRSRPAYEPSMMVALLLYRRAVGRSPLLRRRSRRHGSQRARAHRLTSTPSVCASSSSSAAAGGAAQSRRAEHGGTDRAHDDGRAEPVLIRSP